MSNKKQNTSPAVMQQRAEPSNSLDDFPTPPWATRALCTKLMGLGCDLSETHCLEPAANRGHMVRPLQEYFGRVHASDIHDYGAGFPSIDYLDTPMLQVDWVVTNPPFNAAEAFILKALAETKVGVAVILRTAFLESKGRYNRLFSVQPPSHVFQFSERVAMVKGRLDEKASSATSYAWFVWMHGHKGSTELSWVPPCRERLEQERDYAEE